VYVYVYVYIVRNISRYEFPVRKWIDLNNTGDRFECSEKKDSVQQQRHRQTITYKIIVHTGKQSGSGTDANVSMILYGTFGDTGNRPLKNKVRNLFERGSVDEFNIECLELGRRIILTRY
jgi:lipoxygenase homology domain-containing protein 1